MAGTTSSRHRGPWYHRFLVGVFSFLFGLLIFWLLGFAMNDLGTWPGPDYEQIQEQVLDEDLVAQAERLDEQLASVRQEIQRMQERQTDLRDSTDSAERTMNQLLAIQRLALEKGRELTGPEMESLNEAKQLFLANQQQYQQINEQIAALKERRQALEDQRQALNPQLEEQYREAAEVYQARRHWHDIRMAGLKLAVLIPLLALAGWMVLRWRGSLYVPMIYAGGIAVAFRVGLVMHQHFPGRYFRYLLIAVALAIVAWMLAWLLRRVARPTTQWLLGQYRDAYERFLCPICEFPIRRGPLRYRFWTRRSIKRLDFSRDLASDEGEQPYTCPSCATQLYEQCVKCGQVRPSLLPACPHCGHTKPDTEVIPAADMRPTTEPPGGRD